MEAENKPKTYKRKEFISFLQEVVEDFEKPSPGLEQYMTPYDVAADFFGFLNTNNEISGKIVADFCCGTGLYSAASYFLDGKEIWSFDIDEKALEQCKNSLSNIEDINSHIEKWDLISPEFIAKYKGFFDTVIMNPPFGTKENAGIDMKLLKSAIQVFFL